MEEIGIAFRLPTWLRPSKLTLLDFPVVPIQILDGCLRALVPASGVHQTITPPLPGVVRPFEDCTWLPKLQHYLPHSWVDSSIVTDKAVKSDDADIPSQLWDVCCALIFPKIT
jgi:hypothetical protein